MLILTVLNVFLFYRMSDTPDGDCNLAVWWIGTSKFTIHTLWLVYYNAVQSCGIIP